MWPLIQNDVLLNYNVDYLINMATKKWNVSLVCQVFLPFEVDTILKIPLSYRLPTDQHFWLHIKR